MKKGIASTTQVPRFGVGETDTVLQYLRHTLPAFCKKAGMDSNQTKQFVSAGIASAEACVPLMSMEHLEAGMVNPNQTIRKFWNLAGDILVRPDSEVVGMKNMELALEYMSQGFNVLMIQNHRSGADTLVFETLVRRALNKDVCADWSYMSGHAVNLFLIPLMFCGGMRRFQIFSAKYIANGLDGVDQERMNKQNQRAMLALRRHVKDGGKLVGFYPEGGRGDGCMKVGEPKTSCIPKIIESGAGGKLIVLPTYVRDASNILNPVRGINEYNEVFANSSTGTASLNIGEPILWSDICDLCADADRDEWNRKVNRVLLALVARLGPAGERGPHDPQIVEELVAKQSLAVGV